MHYLFKTWLMALVFVWGQEAMAFTEFTGEFIYTKTVYGETRQNSMRYRRYGLVLVQYIFNLTGIEFNYNQASELTTENNSVEVGQNVILSSMQNKTIVTNYGVGLRQSLAPYGSMITPGISIGYAKQIKNAKTGYTLSDGYTSSHIDVFHGETRNNAVFGTFSLKIALSRLMALTASVQTVFKAYEYNEAKNNITYTGGLSWIF